MCNSKNDSILKVDINKLISSSALVYNHPAERPEEGHAIGNGRMGTMVWTTESAIHLQINRNDVFSVNKNHGGGRGGPADYFGRCAGLTIDLDGTPFKGDNGFLQKLDLYNAEDIIEGDKVRIRCFASSVRDVIAVEIEDQRDIPGQVSISLYMTREPVVRNKHHIASYKFDIDMDQLTVVQEFREKDYYCCSAAAVKITESNVKTTGVVDGTYTIFSPGIKGKRMVLISSAASWDMENDIKNESLKILANAGEKSYADLIGEHKTWWEDFWERSFVYLTSDDGIADFMMKVRNLHLYCMASASRGILPAKWNGSLFKTNGEESEWGSQFWVWPTEISYYPLLAADAADLSEPFFNMHINQLPSAEKAAEQRWEAKGAYFLESGPFDGPVILPEEVAEEYGNIYLGKMTVQDLTENACSFGQFEGVLTQFADGHSSRGEAGRYSYCSHIVSSGSEIAVHAWWRYRYTGDKEWLRRVAYPLLRGTIEFYRHIALKGEDGSYHFEGLNQHEGFWGVNDGITDLAAVRGTVPLAIRAAEILETDRELCLKWKEFLDNLVPYPMGSDPEAVGVADREIWAVGHKGPSSHLQEDLGEALMWPIFPFEDWTLETRDPVIDKIVEKFSYLNSFKNNMLTGRPFGTSIYISAARTPIVMARTGDRSQLPLVLASYYYHMARGAASKDLLSNGFSLFEGEKDPSIEHLGCISTALQEAMLQSLSPHPGDPEVISVFPAWPEKWDASYCLLARGGFVVTSCIEKGKVEFVQIKSRLGGECRVRNPWSKRLVVKGLGGIIQTSVGNVIAFDTVKDEVYLLTQEGVTISDGYCISLKSNCSIPEFECTLPGGEEISAVLGKYR